MKKTNELKGKIELVINGVKYIGVVDLQAERAAKQGEYPVWGVRIDRKNRDPEAAVWLDVDGRQRLSALFRRLSLAWRECGRFLSGLQEFGVVCVCVYRRALGFLRRGGLTNVQG